MAEPRALTPRALIIGAVLVLAMAMLVPFNDWIVGNSPLYNHYMPPAISLVLVCACLLVNPLLRRRRLRSGELGVITIMLLGLGGVVSSGLARYFQASVLEPAQFLTKGTGWERLRQPLTATELAAWEAEAGLRAEAEFRLFDRDGDGALGPSELPGWASLVRLDGDGDGRVLPGEWTAGMIETPSWRWPLDPALFIGIPAAGPVPIDHPGLAQTYHGYQKGLHPGGGPPAVEHRSRITWRDATGRVHDQLALAGRLRDELPDDGILHLDLPPGSLLRSRRAGETVLVEVGRRHVSTPGETLGGIAGRYRPLTVADLQRANPAEGGGILDDHAPLPAGLILQIPDRLEVLAVDGPGIPWSTWGGTLLAWAPLLIGACIAMIALAALVHRQWLHHERLPYPIAHVTVDLLRDPEPGRQLAPLFRSRAFWTGFAIAALVLLWHGLFIWGYLPVDFKLEGRLDLVEFKGPPWDKAYNHRFQFGPQIYFSIIALSFFLATDVSFSIWSFFVGLNLLFIVCAMQGFPLQSAQAAQASIGGFGMYCLIILWIGRQWYWRLLRAAIVGSRDERVRAAVPYVWALLIGMGIMIAFLMLQGTFFLPALCYVLLFLGTLLVIARMVAESGLPFLQTPNGVWLNNVQLSISGLGLPVAALMPLTLIGLTLLADSREAMLPYAVNAGAIGEKTGIAQRRIGPILLGVAVVGGLLAIGTMLVGAYHGEGPTEHWAQTQAKMALEPIAKGLNEISTGGGAEQYQERLHGTWTAYGIGFALVALLGYCRMHFTWWPLHPIGFLLCTSYAGWKIWFSVFLGWLAKTLVLRYGGTATYRTLRPVAIGFIIGEATVGLLFLVTRLIGELNGVELAKIDVLPG